MYSATKLRREWHMRMAHFVTGTHVQGVPKNNPTCFCQNFVKSPVLHQIW